MSLTGEDVGSKSLFDENLDTAAREKRMVEHLRKQLLFSSGQPCNVRSWNK